MNKRLRIFAGPNGSGKSSIIKSIIDKDLGNGVKIDFGIYINADDIANCIRSSKINFIEYSTEITLKEFLDYSSNSGLIHSDFSLSRLSECISIQKNVLSVRVNAINNRNDNAYERIAS